jgi:hypothetical protein
MKEEAHLPPGQTNAGASPMKKTASIPSLAAPHPESALVRSASVPVSSARPPASAADPTFKRAGSLLFNDVLKGNKYAVPSLAEKNNSIIAQLPPPKTSTSLGRASRSAKLKYFLQRLPVVRFVPKKTSVRAITNLRTRRPVGAPNVYNGNTGTFTNANGQQFGEVLTNSALYNCLHVLRSVYTANPALAGFGAFGTDDIYLKLLKYNQQLRASRPELFAHRALGADAESHAAPVAEGGSTVGDAPAAPQDIATGEPHAGQQQQRPRFFVAVLDLEKCYDNVNPQKLYDLLRQLLSRPNANAPSPRPTSSATKNGLTRDCGNKASTEKVIHKYSVTHPIKSMDRNISKNVRCVTTAGEIVPFKEAAAEIAHNYPYSIITDSVVYPKIANEEVLRLLKIHLFQHAVKIPAAPAEKDNTVRSAGAESHFEYFTQVKGIPQGSVLSPLLCTFYYGDAERCIFSGRDTIEKIGLADRTVVIRLMDDYIVISVDQSCVECFLQLAHQALKQYGEGVNPLKTKVNFETSVVVDGAHIPLQQIEGHEMPWCGLLLNTDTLEVTCHFARILDRPLVHSVVVECSCSGAALRRAIKMFMRMKCHAVVLDAALNSKATVVKTLYTMYLIAALRTATYLAQLRKTFPAVGNHRHLLRCIREGVTFGARLIRTRTAKKVVRRLEIGSSGGGGEARWTQHAHDQGNAVPGSQPSLDEPDPELFSRCVEAADPDCFGSCEVSFEEVHNSVVRPSHTIRHGSVCVVLGALAGNTRLPVRAAAGEVAVRAGDSGAGGDIRGGRRCGRPAVRRRRCSWYTAAVRRHCSHVLLASYVATFCRGGNE